jgi:hypothetical protein
MHDLGEGGFLGEGNDVHAEITGGHRGDQPQDGDDGEADDGVGLAALGIAVEIGRHFADFVPHLVV